MYIRSLDLSQLTKLNISIGDIDDAADLRLTIEAIVEKRARETGLYMDYSDEVERIIKLHKERVFTDRPLSSQLIFPRW